VLASPSYASDQTRIAHGERLDGHVEEGGTNHAFLESACRIFPRNALMLFICTFNAIFELAPIVGELFGQFVNPAWHIATDCGRGSRSHRHGIYAASRSTLKDGRERGAAAVRERIRPALAIVRDEAPDFAAPASMAMSRGGRHLTDCLRPHLQRVP